VETFALAGSAANTLTLASGNFTGVLNSRITIFDGGAGNTINGASMPSSDAVTVHAGSGADSLIGGAGNDIFYAGGDTAMTGGGGTNAFVFLASGASNTVADFGSGTNRQVFSYSTFNLGQTGATATPQPMQNTSTLFVRNSTGTFSNTSQRLVYDTNNGELFSSTDGSGGASHLVATLTGPPTLLASQLFFVT
jgi:hypothetical protein